LSRCPFPLAFPVMQIAPRMFHGGRPGSSLLHPRLC
jgi:hypothetical protein